VALVIGWIQFQHHRLPNKLRSFIVHFLFITGSQKTNNFVHFCVLRSTALLPEESHKMNIQENSSWLKLRSSSISLSIAFAATAAMMSSALAADSPKSSRVVPKGTMCQTQDAKACQDAVTPDMVLKSLEKGNKRFVSGRPQAKNYIKQVKATAAGQFPLASIVSCIDSRAPAEIVFDQGIGDVFNARVAGNIVNEDILGSLEFASKVAGSKLIVVLGHTSCGAIKGACDDAKLGNLTGLLGKIKPIAASVAPDVKERTSKNHEFVEMVSAANVKATVQNIREKSPVLKEMEDKGEIKIVGAMYDVKTGRVFWY
jgi:carbonic anhydrase